MTLHDMTYISCHVVSCHVMSWDVMSHAHVCIVSHIVTSKQQVAYRRV